MKDLIPCVDCTLCAIHYGTGFVRSDPVYICTRSGVYVDDGDGCTMGDIGEPNPAIYEYEIDLSANPTA